MDSYQKVVVAQKRGPENEIFVNSKSPASHLLARVTALFQEKGFKEVTFRATGGAISTAVTVAELTKRRVKGLHQITTIGTTDVSSVFEPTIEGLEKHEQTRLVSSIVIQLSLNPLDTKIPGYQAPLSEEDFQAAQQANRSRPPRRTGPPRNNAYGASSSNSGNTTTEGAVSSSNAETSDGNSKPRGGSAPRRNNNGGGVRRPTRGGHGPRPPRSAGNGEGRPARVNTTEAGAAAATTSGNGGNGAAPRGGRRPRGRGPKRTGSRPTSNNNGASPASSPAPTAQ